MNAQLKSWARQLGGDVSGNSVLAPGPGHSAKDRSLSVTPSATSPDGLLVHSFCGDDWQACRDYVRARLGLQSFNRDVSMRRHERAPSNNCEAALCLWRQAIEPRGTLADVYLRSRRLDLPREAANEAIRFHPNCPFGPRERFPAMICLVRNIVTNEPQGMHRTALAPDGTAIKRNGKTFRMSLGSIAGGAIKLDPDEDIKQGLCRKPLGRPG
jgi:putative DNA primase/helicase